MLRQRIVTAIVLAVFFLSVLFGLPTILFSAVMALVVGYAAWEWSALAGFAGFTSRLSYVVALLGVLALVAAFLNLDAVSVFDERIRTLLAGACTWWAIALLWLQGYPSSAILWGRRWLCAGMGFLVLVPTWVAISVLAHSQQGALLVLGVVLLVALADIGAFFSGRAFGRHKLAAQVSPGKTWEGLAGGLIAILLVVTPFALYLAQGNVRQGVQVGAWLLVAGVTGLASVIGDLLESMVKRHRGVKDSGTILPGHGGVLDRIDSLTAALPVFTLLYSLLYPRLL